MIRKVLEEQVKNGHDKKALLAGINSSEFRFREADYGYYPKGLMYGIDIMDSWLYGEGDPFAYVKQLDIYKELRDAVESDYYEKLVQKYMLDNTHVAVVVVAPEKGLTAKLEAETAKKLADFKAGLSEEQVKGAGRKNSKTAGIPGDTVHTGRAGENPDAYQGGYHKEMQTDLQQRAFFWQHQSSVA